MPASSSRPMNCRFGIGLSMISSTTCSRVRPWRARQRVDLRVDQRRLHVARAHRVDRDVAVARFQRDALAEADQTMLRGDVRALVRRCDQRMDRADVDDAAEALAAHRRQRRARQQRRAGQHHCDQLLPLLRRKFLERRDVLQAGVVDQHVRRIVGHARQRALDLRGVRDVERERANLRHCVAASSAAAADRTRSRDGPARRSAASVPSPMPLAAPVMRMLWSMQSKSALPRARGGGQRGINSDRSR